MRCEKVEEFDETTATRDREIAEQKLRLARWVTKRPLTYT